MGRNKSAQGNALGTSEEAMIGSGNGSMMNEWKLREQMCEIGRRVYNKGFAAANDGNISLRIGDDRVLCTPTRVSKGFMKPDDLCIVDMNGQQVSGKRKRSSEILMHLTIMKARADVRSVVHCHPPHATAFAVAREPIPKCVLPEIEVFLGEVAISPYETPGSQTFADTVLPFVKDTDTILLANHGTVTYGSDLEDAYFKTEIIDAYCRILILARQIGRVNYYTDEKAAELIRLKPNLGIADPRLERGLENCDLCGNSLFREGYGEPSPDPRVFIHPKIAGSVPHPSPIESRLTPLAGDVTWPKSEPKAPAQGPSLGKPSANGQSSSATMDEEALVQTITDQVMRALNGAVK
jgi:L-fuculose-phosphate aldolase